MNPTVVAFVALLALTACGGAATASVIPPVDTLPTAPTLPPPTAAPVWSDEFDGPAGATFDRTRWAPDGGGTGFGNQEREFYTTRPENIALDGQGHLVFTALAETPSAAFQCWYGPCRYTSARLKTIGLFAQTYGRFEARIHIPRGQGIWPAFWMLGANVDQVGWPRSGEIDIMENIGKEPATVHGTLHGPGYSGSGGISGISTIASGAFADDFHVFTVSWEASEIRWYVDGRLYHRIRPATLPSGTAWVFDHPFFLLLNLAVGGAWPGDPDGTTTFPQAMIVDYVRVYRDP
jgi:beta-glucanase (GH16 family)